MRIGIFTDTYLPDINGVASSSFILRNELVRHGHDVLVVTTEVKKGEIYKDEGNVLRLSGIELKKLYNYRLSSFFSLKAMAKIREMQLDVIHVQTEFSIGIFGKIAAHILNIPVVYTYHTQYEDYVHYAPVVGKIKPMQPLLKEGVSWISRIYGDNCTELIAPSQKTKDILEKYGIENTIHVIPTGLELSRFERDALDEKLLEKVRQECHTDVADTFTLLFLGRVAPEKSIDMIIDCMPELKENQPSIRLVIVGGGPGLEDLQDQAKRLGVQDIIYFAGPKEAALVPYYYYACDAFISASISETQGLTYIEAMAAHLPVLARYDKNLDGIIQNQQNGFFFYDQPSLIERVKQLASMDLTAMKQQAYEDSKKYSSEAFYEAVIQVYQDAILHKHYSYKLTSISSKPNHMCEVVLKLDHQSIVVHLPEKYVLSHQLENGQIIEHEMFEEMQTYEMVVKGYKKALKFLTTRDYTEKQMVDKLQKNGHYTSEQLTMIISLLKDKHLIDDDAYVEDYMRRVTKMGMGIKKAILKLKEKGISDEQLESVHDHYSKALQIEGAIEIARKMYYANRSKSQRALKHAIYDRLYYQGFEADVIDAAMKQVPFEVNEQFEKQLIEKEYDKARKKYEKKYEGKELNHRILAYLSRKGFQYDMMKEVLEERKDLFDED